MAYYILSNPMLIQTYAAEPAIQLTAKSTSRAEVEVLITKEVQNVEGIPERMVI